MAVTENLLVFIGVFATVASGASVFVSLGDRLFNAALAVLASILWGTFGISSYSVVVGDGTVVATVEITYLVYFGVGMAFIMFIWGIFEVLQRLGSEARAGTADLT